MKIERQLALALRTVLWQAALVLVIFCPLLFVYKLRALDFLWGGLVVALPNLMFAYYFFSGWRQRTAKQVILMFYIGEVIKMFLSGVLSIFFVKWFHVGLGMYIVGMVVAYLTFWIMAPLMMQQQQRVTC